MTIRIILVVGEDMIGWVRFFGGEIVGFVVVFVDSGMALGEIR